MTASRRQPTPRQPLDSTLIPMAIVIALALLVSSACGSGSGSADSDEGQVGQVAVLDAWTRATAPGAMSTAFYLDINNDAGVEDQLVGAESPRCEDIELHNSTMVDGVMSMSPAESDDLTVDAGDQLRLEPGGLHVMCMGLETPVVAGEQVELTLRFEQAGSIVVEATAEAS